MSNKTIRTEPPTPETIKNLGIKIIGGTYTLRVLASIGIKTEENTWIDHGVSICKWCVIENYNKVFTLAGTNENGIPLQIKKWMLIPEELL